MRARITGPWLMSVAALLMNVLLPVIDQPPLLRCASVRMPDASDPAPCSVRPKEPSFSPVASGVSQRCFWSSEPNVTRGREPIVRWACQAAAIDWSTLATSSSPATSARVLVAVPPY